MFVTNNSFAPVADQEAALAAIGIPAVGDVLTSAMAAAALVEPGERVLVVRRAGHQRGDDGARRAPVAGDDPAGVDVDAVMVGFHREFDYERHALAADRRAARRPADRHQRRRDLPDAGRADPRRRSDPRRVATAAGRQPVVAGKPYAPMAAAVRTLAR